MSNADDTHFDSYRRQTRIKHAILDGYLKPFYEITKGYWNRLLYVDGFAGRGYYLDEAGTSHPGSPLRALSLFGSKREFAERIQAILVEERGEYFSDLETAVQGFAPQYPFARTPVVWNEPFEKAIPRIRRDFGDPAGRLPATFLFVDPCGVEGFPIQSLTSLLAGDGCEGFLFFNYEGVNRVVGNAEVVGGSPTLNQLLGDSSLVTSLLKRTANAATPDEREQIIVAEYCRILRQRVPAQFVLTFRVEHEAKQATSHYFIHVTKNATGFRIMKEVMWKAGQGVGNIEGQFELLQSSQQADGLFLRPDLQDQAAAVLRELVRGAAPVIRFYKDWVHRPEDIFTESSYRRCLLRLEAERKIQVVKENGTTPYPADLRRPYKGEPTLSEKLWVRLHP